MSDGIAARTRAPVGESGSTFAYLVLLGLGALDAAGYSIVAPILPLLSTQTGAGPGLIGMLVASFPLGIVVGFVLAGLGIRGQRYRTVLLVSLGLVGVGALGFAAAGDLPGYFAARTLMGLGSGGLWLGITFQTLDRWPGQEYLCMSRIFAAYSVGGLIGPLLGAIGGIRGPFLAYFGLVCIAGALVAAMGTSTSGRRFATDRTALGLRAFRVAALGILFAVLALGIVEGVLPLHLATRLGQTEIGLLYAGMSLIVAAAATLAARFQPAAMLLAATTFVVAGITLTAAAGTIPPWMLGLAVAGIGLGMANTGSIGVLLQGIPTERSVTAIVVWSQIGIVGYLLGPAVGGSVAQIFGFEMLGPVVVLAAIPVVFLAWPIARGSRSG